MPHVETIEASDSPSLKTYEDKLKVLISIGMHPYEVHVMSDRFNIHNDVFKFDSKEDALEFCRPLVDAARVTHGEDIIPARWAGERPALSRTYSYDEVFRNYETSLKGWTIILYCAFSRIKGTEDISIVGNEFIEGWRYGAMRMAHPTSKVFVRYFGRDCDGYSWESVYEYPTLRKAANDFEEQCDNADGPMYFEVISRDQFEAW